MPCVLRRVGIGAGEAHAPVGELRVARPHLLAVEHASRRRRVRARVESDARSLPAPGSLNSWHQISSARRGCCGQPARLLLGGAVGEERRPDEVDADAADELRGAGPGELLGDDVVLDRPGAAAAVLLAASATPTQRPLGELAPATRGRTRPRRRGRRSAAAGPCRTPTAGSPAATTRHSSARACSGGGQRQVHRARRIRG